MGGGEVGWGGVGDMPVTSLAAARRHRSPGCLGKRWSDTASERQGLLLTVTFSIVLYTECP